MTVPTSFALDPSAAAAPAPRRARRALLALGLLLVPLGAYAASHALRPAVVPGAPGASGNPLATISRTEQDLAPVTGTVTERLPAGGYTYLAVRRDDGSLVWTVTLGPAAVVGDHVTVRSFGRKTDFVSRRLHRTFSELVFGLVSRQP